MTARRSESVVNVIRGDDVVVMSVKQDEEIYLYIFHHVVVVPASYNRGVGDDQISMSITPLGPPLGPLVCAQDILTTKHSGEKKLLLAPKVTLRIHSFAGVYMKMPVAPILRLMRV